MALVNPYCTVEDVQNLLKNDKDDIIPDIERAINEATLAIDDYRGRDFRFHDHSTSPLTVDAFDIGVIVEAELFLPFFPVITLTEVVVAGVTWVEDEDYIVKTDRLIAIGGSWPLCAKTDRITIKGTFGYAQTTEESVPTGIPFAISQAAALIAAAFSGHNQKEIAGMDGNKTQVSDGRIPKDALTLLGNRHLIV